MKKKMLLSLLLVFSLSMFLLTACGEDEEVVVEDELVEEEEVVEEEAEEAEEDKEEAKDEDRTFVAGLVTDTGGIDDQSFNQGTWEGLELFVNSVNGTSDYLQSEADADYIPNLSSYADDNIDLILAPGFLFEEAMGQVADNYPEQNFLIIDSVVERDNVASAVFAEHEGSFLVGVAAGLKAQEAGENTVGFIGGIDFPLIQRFEAGFEAGVHAVNPDIEVLVSYVGAFDDVPGGRAEASIMYDDGAYIIFHAAGGTGNGLINEARERRSEGQDVWAIGVDRDQYEDGIYDREEGKSAILTSMMKRVDVAAHDVAKMTYEGNFPGGQILVFDLENGGVSLPEENPNLSDEILEEVEEYVQKILSGEIEVSEVPSRVQE